MKVRIVSIMSVMLMLLSLMYFIPAHAKGLEGTCFLVVNNDTKSLVVPAKKDNPLFIPGKALQPGQTDIFRMKCDRLQQVKMRLGVGKMIGKDTLVVYMSTAKVTPFDCAHCSCFDYHHNKGNKHMDGHYCKCGC